MGRTREAAGSPPRGRAADLRRDGRRRRRDGPVRKDAPRRLRTPTPDASPRRRSFVPRVRFESRGFASAAFASAVFASAADRASADSTTARAPLGGATRVGSAASVAEPHPQRPPDLFRGDAIGEAGIVAAAAEGSAAVRAGDAPRERRPPSSSARASELVPAPERVFARRSSSRVVSSDESCRWRVTAPWLDHPMASPTATNASLSRSSFPLSSSRNAASSCRNSASASASTARSGGARAVAITPSARTRTRQSGSSSRARKRSTPWGVRKSGASSSGATCAGAGADADAIAAHASPPRGRRRRGAERLGKSRSTKRLFYISTPAVSRPGENVNSSL